VAGEVEEAEVDAEVFRMRVGERQVLRREASVAAVKRPTERTDGTETRTKRTENPLECQDLLEDLLVEFSRSSRRPLSICTPH